MQADPTRAVDTSTIMWQKEVESGFGMMLSKVVPMLRGVGEEEVGELIRKARELDTKVTV